MTLQQRLPFTVLKLVQLKNQMLRQLHKLVATALTVYGIETRAMICAEQNHCLLKLQQRLPFTVLKLFNDMSLGNESGCNSAYRLRY